MATPEEYAGPDCTDQSTAGDWCGACDACRAALDWLDSVQGADCPTCSDYVLDQDGTCAKCGSVPSIQY